MSMTRIVTVVLPVVAALLTLTGCVGRMGPVLTGPLERSPVVGECATSDIEVTGALDEQPRITLPTDCAPPTVLLAQDLREGRGPRAFPHAELSVSYVLITWSSGEKLDSTWSGNNTLPISVSLSNLGDSGWIRYWDEGLLGIRAGGRRLIVVPVGAAGTRKGSGTSSPGETLVFVVDAITITPR
jgi:peptidylprolyl isomerase